jgi:hypothetical protein
MPLQIPYLSLFGLIIINIEMKKLPKPPPITGAAERRELEKNLKRYNCTLSEGLSERARNLGLEEGKTVCSLVNTAVEKYIQEKRNSENS